MNTELQDQRTARRGVVQWAANANSHRVCDARFSPESSDPCSACPLIDTCTAFVAMSAMATTDTDRRKAARSFEAVARKQWRIIQKRKSHGTH